MIKIGIWLILLTVVNYNELFEELDVNHLIQLHVAAASKRTFRQLMSLLELMLHVCKFCCKFSFLTAKIC